MSFVYHPENKEFIYAIAMVRDITENVKIRKALKESQNQLKQQNKDLEKIVDERTAELIKNNTKLENSNYDLSQFAYAASHDLQEPLRTIGSFSSLLDKRFSPQLGEEGKEYIGFITSGVSRMSNLIRNLLTYSQINNTDHGFSDTNLTLVIKEVIESFALKIAERNVQISIQNLPETIHCEKNKISMLFLQLDHQCHQIQ